MVGPFYTMPEALQTLGIDAEALSGLVSGGEIHEHTLDGDSVYLAKDVDSLAAKMGVVSDEEGDLDVEGDDGSDPGDGDFSDDEDDGN